MDYVKYGIKRTMRNTYIRALKTIRETEESSECLGTQVPPLNEIGVRKLSTVATLPTEKRNQLIENAPLNKTTII